MSSNTQIDPETDVQNKVETAAERTDALTFKKRMLQWSNPVEYVNNMYGCHPGDDNTEYFDVVFRK